VKRVAIGLPVFNGEEFLAAAVESILAQTFTDFDLFISDNASTDRTEEICRRFADRDSRVVYVRQTRNIGAIPNFNAVAGMSHSPYFKWAAHDDVLAPTYLAECVAVLDANPSVVAASPATSLIDEAGTALAYSREKEGMIDNAGNCWPELPEKNGDLVSSDPAVRFEAVVHHTNLCVEIFGLMRRSALSRCLPQGAYLGSDKVVIAKLCLIGPFWLGTEPLFYRRCHAQQFSAQIMRTTAGTSRSQWFRGSSKSAFAHNIYFEKLILLGAYIRAITISDLTRRQRVACLGTVARRAASRKVWDTLTAPILALRSVRPPGRASAWR